MVSRSTPLRSVLAASTQEGRSQRTEVGLTDARAGRLRLAAVGLSLFVVALNWTVQGSEAVSPGLACCAVLLWLTRGLVDERDLPADGFQIGWLKTDEFNAWRLGVGVPLLFAVWSCWDDTFVVGWSLLGAAAVGRGLDWVRDSRRLTSLARDRSFVRWLSLLGLAIAATLLGPNGIAWIEQARVEVALLGDSLDRILSMESAAFAMPVGDEWDAAWWRSTFLAGVAGGGVGWLTLPILKPSRRRVASAEGLVWLLFTALYWLRPGLSAWSVLVWTIALAPHLADLAEQWLMSDKPLLLGEPGGAPAALHKKCRVGTAHHQQTWNGGRCPPYVKCSICFFAKPASAPGILERRGLTAC